MDLFSIAVKRFGAAAVMGRLCVPHTVCYLAAAALFHLHQQKQALPAPAAGGTQDT